MPVLTHNDFLKVKQDKTQGDESLKDTPPKSIDISTGEEKPSPVEIFKYYLLHPENGVGSDLQNFEDVINLNGKDYKRVCKNGVVVTEEKELAEFLIGKGYPLMEKIAV